MQLLYSPAVRCSGPQSPERKKLQLISPGAHPEAKNEPANIRILPSFVKAILDGKNRFRPGKSTAGSDGTVIVPRLGRTVTLSRESPLTRVSQLPHSGRLQGVLPAADGYTLPGKPAVFSPVVHALRNEARTIKNNRIKKLFSLLCKKTSLSVIAMAVR